MKKEIERRKKMGEGKALKNNLEENPITEMDLFEIAFSFVSWK